MTKPIAPRPPTPLPVSEKAPEGACDTHVHMLGAPQEYPLFDGRAEDPAQNYAAFLADYKAHLANFGITRGVIVQSIFYGLDKNNSNYFVSLVWYKDTFPIICTGTFTLCK